MENRGTGTNWGGGKHSWPIKYNQSTITSKKNYYSNPINKKVIKLQNDLEGNPKKEGGGTGGTKGGRGVGEEKTKI